jgi:hypothetical protein
MIDPQDESRYSEDVNEMLDMLVELSAARWQSNNYTAGYLKVHIKKLCELHASKARIDTLTEIKNQMDEQKKEQEKGSGT